VDESLATAETLEWLRSALPAPPRRLLEVGCGAGELAAALVRRGYDVVAVDLDAAQVEAARRRGVDARQADVAALEAEGFDAVLFTCSLHHVTPLDMAVVRAQAATRPGGAILCEEFAVEAGDEDTTRWFYARVAALEDAKRLAPDPHAVAFAALDAPERWRREHEGLHTATAMMTALRARFGAVAVETAPYLYRYVAGRALDVRAGVEMLAEERAAIAAGAIQAVGRRIVAR
jgi:SAM-dependent methyltransferase